MDAAHAVIDQVQRSSRPVSIPAARGYLRSPLCLSLIAALLLWAALPPLNIAALAWLASLPLLALVEQGELVGRRPYLQIWLGGFAFWLAAIYWLTLPHWATSVGWLALSFYLALYWPLFVGLVRVAVWRLNLSIVLAAPVVYLGLELARSHALTGFMLTGLGHTQYRWTTLVQLADLGGVNLVSALVMFVAACLTRFLPLAGRRFTFWPLAPAGLALAAALAYGSWRTSQQSSRPGPTVGLIQGSIDITMKIDPAKIDEIFKQYLGLTREAIERGEKLDLIVWPETMFRYPWFLFSEDYEPPADADWTAEQAHGSSLRALEEVTGWLHTPILLGIDTVHYKRDGIDRFNSALLVGHDSAPGERYDKRHLVMFGEYVPFATWFPWLYRLTPLPGGLNAGSGPIAVKVGEVCYSPDICFESTVSHFIRGQVNTLREQGEEPDVLVNLTNDGWFWGSSELEMHLSCEVFRAIECRKPYLIAANTGISAWIDANGRVREQGPKRATDVIIAHTELDNRRSPYLAIGDWPAGFCLMFCGVLAWIGRKTRPPGA